MKCEQAKELMNAFVDGEINQHELNKLNQHLDSCEACTVEFEEIKYMVQLMGEIDLKELPVGFEEELHEKLKSISQEHKALTSESKSNVLSFSNALDKIKKIKNIKIKKSYWIYALSSVAVVMIIMVSTGNFLGVSKDEAVMSANDMIAPEYGNEMQTTTNAARLDGSTLGKVMAPARGEDGAQISFLESAVAPQDTYTNAEPNPKDDSTANTNYRDERLIIQSANMRLDVEKYDSVLEQIKTLVNGSGGYIENESTSYKTFYDDRDNLKAGYLTLRIPASGFDSIITQVKAMGLVTSDYVNAYDVTKDYRNTASEVENLKVTESRLREIMTQAIEIEDILSIENELTRIRGQINGYERQLKDWEALVDLATVTVELNEVKSLKPIIEPIDDSLFGKAKEGLINTINNMKGASEKLFVWTIANSPFLVIIAVLVVIARAVIFKRRKINEK